MENNLMIGILGNHKSGRSYTWKHIFEKRVITGKKTRRLYLNEFEYVEVFLINGSPTERKKEVDAILKSKIPRIILCSLEYHMSVKTTIKYFLEHNYKFYVQWLNPGFNDPNEKPLFYTIGIINNLLSNNAIVSVRNAKDGVDMRAEEIKTYIYGWAKRHSLICIDKKKQIKAGVKQIDLEI